MTDPTPNERSSASPSSAGDVAALLDEPPRRPWWRRPWPWLLLALAVLTVAGVAAWQARQAERAQPSYVTEPATRGDLRVAVTANGTLQPTRQVNIGSELSGTVARVLVDVNDRVTKGQVLVELDTAKLNDQILRSRAAVASAQAKVTQAAATLQEARAILGRYEEVARLSGGKVPSKAELDTARATVARAEADAASARAGVADARAALSTDETNLRKASIRSPTDGVVLTRAVDPGNAVAASLQAVTLFTIAEDLSRLRLQINVDEADVGSVAVGQTATFTVSAWPGRRYPATVTRVAYGSTTTDNVVTYITYLAVDNPDGSLRPGMTATASIATTDRHDVLLVPNTALRYTPWSAAPGAGSGPGGAAGPAGASGGNRILSALVPRPPGMGQQRRSSQGGGGRSANAPGGTASGAGAGGLRRVWVLRDGQPAPVTVRTGVTDGRVTEVTPLREAELAPGTPVVTDQRSRTSS